MDIHLLRTFVAAFEETNFTKAARRLNATQPGVSVQIAALEAYIGTRLFDRNARCVTPTVAGRRLYPRALKLIQDFKSTAQEIRALAGAVAERVAVGIPSILGAELVPTVLPRYLAAYPHNDLRIVEGHGDSLLSQIESGELDLALVAQPLDHPAIVERRICRDRIILASGRRSDVDPHCHVDLDANVRYKIVVPSMLRHVVSCVRDEPVRERRIVAERLMEVDGLACMLRFVAETDWVALLPASAVSDDSHDPRVRFSPIFGDEIALDCSIVHARTAPPSAAAQAFVDLAAAELNRLSKRWKPRVPAQSRRSAQQVRLPAARAERSAPTTARSVA